VIVVCVEPCKEFRSAEAWRHELSAGELGADRQRHIMTVIISYGIIRDSAQGVP